jgi:hypothetical protein
MKMILMALILLVSAPSLALECRLGDFLVNLFFGRPYPYDLNVLLAERSERVLLESVRPKGAVPYNGRLFQQLKSRKDLNWSYLGLSAPQLKNALQGTKVEKIIHLADGGANTAYLVSWKNGAHGIFKPRLNARDRIKVKHEVSMGDPMNEVVSFVVDRHYGFGLTPPTIFIQLPGEKQSVTGSLMLFSPGDIKWLDHNLASHNDDLLMLDLFDYLIQNSDRHMGNMLVHPLTKKLVAIDHGITFWQGERFLKKLYPDGNAYPFQVDPELKFRYWDPIKNDFALAEKGRSQERISRQDHLVQFFKTPEGEQILNRLKLTDEDQLVQVLKHEIPELTENELRSYVTRLMLRQKLLLEHLQRFGIQ